jgi:hypothetical protein
MKNSHLGMALGCFLLLPLAARADERLFTYTYQAEVLPKGAMEFEQWITNRNGHAAGVFSAFDLREEFETGLTDKLTTAVYLNTKSEYQSVYDDTLLADVTTEEFHFEGVSNEWKYLAMSPLDHWLGVLGYVELGYNGPEFEAEAKLILEHRFSPDLVWAMNFVVENEYAYEASLQSVTGKSEFTTGLSYRLIPEFAVGLEARNQREWPDNWGYQGSSAWYLGPSLHTVHDKWWATLTVLPQLTGQPETISGDGRELVDHEKMESRLIFGVNF